jgi:ABC-type glutathione transport system ATPase component
MLEMCGLSKHFFQGHVFRQRRSVIPGADLFIGESETLGLIGPSGAGKSTIGKLAVRLLEPTGGRLLFEGKDITHAGGRELKRLREKIQIIFQHPQSSLHPRKKIRALLREPLRMHDLTPRSGEEETVSEILTQVGLHEDILERYPAEISGGEIQRIVIARVTALCPRFIVLDEPTSMLDVSVQANILHLLMDIQKKTGVSYLFISHDMRIVRRVCDQVAVMEKGRIVEQGPVSQVMTRPQHPCTKKFMKMGGL